MEARHLGTCVTNDKMDKLSVPPGFVSLTSFTLKRVGNSEEPCTSSAPGNECILDAKQMDTATNTIDDAKIKRSLKHRPWILHKQLKCSPQESDSKLLDMEQVTTRSLPKDARVPILEEAPVFYPTGEEFKDIFKYVASIRPQGEQYGMCRIIPPPSWQPPCIIQEKNLWETSEFSTHVQQIDKLQYLLPKRKLDRACGKMKEKKGKILSMAMEYSCDGFSMDFDEAGHYTGSCEFQRGPEFTFETFKRYADDFKRQYFCKKNRGADSDLDLPAHEHCEQSVVDVEGEYWRIIENPSEEVEVLFGGDADTGEFGTRFLLKSNYLKTLDHPEDVESGWNLNDIPKHPGSLLVFENRNNSSVLLPRFHVGMCFSSLCWKVEEHNLYSFSYLHMGAPKIWYAVPGRYCFKFEAAMKKKFPDLLRFPELLHKLVYQLPSSVLSCEGIPVYRCVQYPREFVLFFPQVYYSGVDCGFNCSSAVNFAPFDWLPHGYNATELYSEQGRKTSISYDKQLLGAAAEAVKAQWELSLLGKNSANNLRCKSVCGKDGILTKALRSRVNRESMKREYLCSLSRSRKMEKDFDATIKRECSICLYDLHLSAVGCPCSPERYSCPSHSKQLCYCGWSSKFFLFRYEISELNVLVEALEGKLSAVYKWAKENLGLAVHSYTSKNISQVCRPTSAENVKQREASFTGTATSSDVCGSSLSVVNSGLQEPVLGATTVSTCRKNVDRTTFLVSSSGTRDGLSLHRQQPYVNSRVNVELKREGSCLAGGTNSQVSLPKEVQSQKSSPCTSSEQNADADFGRKSRSNSPSPRQKRPRSLAFCKSDIILLSDDERES